MALALITLMTAIHSLVKMKDSVRLDSLSFLFASFGSLNLMVVHTVGRVLNAS